MLDPNVVKIARSFRQISHEVDRYSKFLQENYNITVPQLACLREIHEQGPISLGELSKFVFVNSSTVTGIVDRLEQRNLVRRTRTSKDRRKIHAEITEEGVRFIANAPAPIEERFVKRLEKLENQEIESILVAVEKLVALLNAPEDNPQ